VRSDKKRAGGGWLYTGAIVVPPWLAGNGRPLTGVAAAHHRSPFLFLSGVDRGAGWGCREEVEEGPPFVVLPDRVRGFSPSSPFSLFFDSN